MSENIQVIDKPIDLLLRPMKLWRHSEIMVIPCPIPGEPGVYGWYFKKLSSQVPSEGCCPFEGFALLYVGISPSEPAKSGKQSLQNLKTRIRTHFGGNAFGSTLRLTLGCLLKEELGIRLQCVGNSGRLTFGEGENKLSHWMAENALVNWVVQKNPWEYEKEIIRTFNLPLNLKGNETHSFHPILSDIRAACRRKAREGYKGKK